MTIFPMTPGTCKDVPPRGSLTTKTPHSYHKAQLFIQSSQYKELSNNWLLWMPPWMCWSSYEPPIDVNGRDGIASTRWKISDGTCLFSCQKVLQNTRGCLQKFRPEFIGEKQSANWNQKKKGTRQKQWWIKNPRGQSTGASSGAKTLSRNCSTSSDLVRRLLHTGGRLTACSLYSREIHQITKLYS